MVANRPLILAAALLALGGTLWIALSSSGSAERPPADPVAPNIVVVMTDDQNAGTVNRRTMPRTTRLLKRGGVEFTDAVVTTPQCCPSRAAFLSGQYGHNNGVLSNSDGYSGLTDPANVLPTWLQLAGYTTAHVGRFLTGYAKAPSVGLAADPPPGWDEWAGTQAVRYYDYTISYDGTVVRYGNETGDYSTTVLTEEAVGLVRDYVPQARPLFLSVAYVAPHKERKAKPAGYCGGLVTPAPGDAQRFRDEPLPASPSIWERDISDKPYFIRDRAPVEHRRAKTERAYRCGLAALREVDRGVARIFNAFREAGEVDNAVFIFTSDNGRFNGEHRLPGGKSFPYQESIRVPLLIRLPQRLGGAAAHAVVPELAANIDLAPTILDLARAQPCLGTDCRLLDGRSLLPLMTGRAAEWPRDRGVLIELREHADVTDARLPCSYVAVRTSRDFYIEYTEVRDAGSGVCVPFYEVEYYDLVADPYQLTNLARDGSVETRRIDLARRVVPLTHCQGVAGRDLPEGAQPCE